MSSNDDLVRVHRDDLATLVNDLTDTKRALHECVQSATSAAKDWQRELDGFRRAVQEALGIDEPVLRGDDELITLVRTLATPQPLQPWPPTEIDPVRLQQMTEDWRRHISFGLGGELIPVEHAVRDPRFLHGVDPNTVAPALEHHRLVDLLSLVDVTVHPETVLTWTMAEREQATVWATAQHLAASDNDVEIPPRPTFLLGTMASDQPATPSRTWRAGDPEPAITGPGAVIGVTDDEGQLWTPAATETDGWGWEIARTDDWSTWGDLVDANDTLTEARAEDPRTWPGVEDQKLS